MDALTDGIAAAGRAIAEELRAIAEVVHPECRIHLRDSDGRPLCQTPLSRVTDDRGLFNRNPCPKCQRAAA